MSRLRRFASATLLLSSLSAAASADGGDPLTLALDQDVYDVGDPVRIEMSGGPQFGIVVMMLDLEAGPGVLPVIGNVEVAVSDTFTYVEIGSVAAGITVDCAPFDCDSILVGTKVYMQLASLDVSGEVCTSNLECLLVEDLSGQCGASATGCTPGYWKNHPETWAPTGYDPSNDWDTVFGIDVFGGSATLIQALQPPAVVDQLEIHAVAALLNASHPSHNYPYTPEEVIELTAEAFLFGTAQQREDLKDAFDFANNAGCPF